MKVSLEALSQANTSLPNRATKNPSKQMLQSTNIYNAASIMAITCLSLRPRRLDAPLGQVTTQAPQP